MTAECEKQERSDINRFTVDLTTAQQGYCAYLKQIFSARDNVPRNTNETFTANNPHFAELVRIYTDAFRLARGAEVYEIRKSLDETATWFDKAMKSPEVQFPFFTREMPAMTGERFQQLLKEDIDSQSKPDGKKVDAIQEGVRKKFGLKDLRYAVVASEATHNRISNELLKDSGMAGHNLGFSRQITVRAWSVKNAWKAFDCLVECRQEGKEADIDVIFLSTSLPYKRRGDRESSFGNVQRFLKEFEEAVALHEVAPYFKDTKIVVVDENLDPEILEKLQIESARVLGGINMTTEESNLPVPVALAGLLADKGIIALDLKHIDAQLRLHADNFNKAVRNLLREKTVDRSHMWDNEPFLREMHSLINAYRAAEGLEPTIFQTKGWYLYVFIMEEIRQGRYVPFSLLFGKDSKGVQPNGTKGPHFQVLAGGVSGLAGRRPVF